MSSINVWAEKFQLMELTSASNGTYNKEGRKVSMGSKFIDRAWATGRNMNDNNELYVFDEVETERLDNVREANKIEQAEKLASQSVSSEDKLAAAMVKAMGNINATPETVKTPVESVDDLEDLKTIIKENDLGIRVAKSDTREKVEAKIKEAQSK